MNKQIIKKVIRICIDKTIIYISKITKTNLIELGYKQIGISNFGTNEITGEKYLVEIILKKYFLGEQKYIFFDVGANIGEYSKLLRSNFKQANIFSFEPNPKAFILLKNIAEKENINVENKGLGEKIDPKKTLFSFKELSSTELGTTNVEILKNYKVNEEIEEISFFSDTIDNYCTTNNIKVIDFLKIDVEGDELSVLKGAKNLLTNNKIKIIQFEFNQPNINNRIFLRDFYILLENYNFYRIKKDSLIKLGNYDSRNEIFSYQNILAINKNIFIKVI